VTIGGVFLAEAYSHGSTAEVRATLDRCVKEIERRMEKSGGWGHYHGGPNALNYVELEVMSTWALGTLGICKREKIRINSSKVTRAFKFIQDCCAPGKGGVGYSPNRGQKGMGNAGRTGGAIWLFALHGQTGHPLYGKMGAFWRTKIDNSTNGHGSIALGCLGSALGARQLGSADWDNFVAKAFPKILKVRKADGSFGAIKGTGLGSAGSDNSAGANYNTALYALVMQLDLGNLNYVGAKVR
jgi:hypothetical protein